VKRVILCLRRHWWIVLGVVVVAGWVFWSSISLVKARNERQAAIAGRIAESQNSRRTLCVDGNQVREGLRVFLANVYPDPDDPRIPPERGAIIRAQLAYGNALFADRNCDDVVKGLPPPPLPPPPTIPLTAPAD
jgi:hypothetical protein